MLRDEPHPVWEPVWKQYPGAVYMLVASTGHGVDEGALGRTTTGTVLLRVDAWRYRQQMST